MIAGFATPLTLSLSGRPSFLITSLSHRPTLRAPRPSTRGVRALPVMVQPQQQQLPSPSAAALSTFASFFSTMRGAWNSQRTYHYLTPGQPQTREESQTTFDVERLLPDKVRAVLAANGASAENIAGAQGFRVSFLTRMASQDELVRAGTNLAFMPEAAKDGRIVGAYYRDVGYEEKGAVKAAFGFDVAKNELQMVTFYSKVVSVDEIRLVNENLRLRRIVNYRRPDVDGAPLKDIMLVGYGVECKGETSRLVE